MITTTRTQEKLFAKRRAFLWQALLFSADHDPHQALHRAHKFNIDTLKPIPLFHTSTADSTECFTLGNAAIQTARPDTEEMAHLGGNAMTWLRKQPLDTAPATISQVQ